MGDFLQECGHFPSQCQRYETIQRITIWVCDFNCPNLVQIALEAEQRSNYRLEAGPSWQNDDR